MEKITVYTTESCPYCVMVKRLLDGKGLPYEEINLARDPEGRQALVDRTGRMSFPQVIIGDEVLGGFDETRAAEKSGRLADMLAA